MKRTTLVLSVLATSLLLLPVGASASPIVIGGITYVQSGPSEQVDALFTVPDGGVSVNGYSGLVEITVWGTGESRSTQENDAFYVYSDLQHNPITPFHHSGYYELAFDSAPLIPYDPSRHASGFIVYDLDAGTPVTAPYLPAYRPDHTYSFVIDTGLLQPSLLHFGVSDGIFADNSGTYHIQLQQLQPVPIPEPGSLALLGTGLGLAGLQWRRRARSRRRG